MAPADTTSPPSPKTKTTPWRVVPLPPGGPRKTYYLRARRTNGETGKREESRESIEASDLAGARRLAAAKEASLNGTSVSGNPTLLAVIDARMKVMETDPRTEPGTLKKYRRMRKIVATLDLAAVRASELTRKQLKDGREAIRASGKKGCRANSTTNSTMFFISACWRWAHEEREMITTPWPKLDPLDESKPAIPKRAYTDAEVTSILSYIAEHDPAWLAPFSLLAETGARLNDILSLRSDDVLRSEQVIILRDPKTHDPIEVGVPAEVMRLLPERAPGAYLFPSRVAARSGEPVTDSGALRCLRRTLRALKIGDADWLDLHSFRRSWCAASEEAGVAQHQAMKQTGHKRPEMFNHYASKARGKARETAERVHAHRQRVAREALAVSSPSPSVAPSPSPSSPSPSSPGPSSVAPPAAPAVLPSVIPSGDNPAQKSLWRMVEEGCQEKAGGSGLVLARRGSHAFARPSSGSAAPSSASPVGFKTARAASTRRCACLPDLAKRAAQVDGRASRCVRHAARIGGPRRVNARHPTEQPGGTQTAARPALSKLLHSFRDTTRACCSGRVVPEEVGLRGSALARWRGQGAKHPRSLTQLRAAPGLVFQIWRNARPRSAAAPHVA
jgi:integrase